MTARLARMTVLALLTAILPGTAAATSSPSCPGPAGSGEPTRTAVASQPRPATAPAAPVEFPDPPRTLRRGSPRQAGLVPEHLAKLDDDLHAGLTAQPHPRYPGAVALAGRRGVIAYEQAVGKALRYADDAPTELPAERQRPMRTGTIFDLASVSKLFTSTAVMQLVERGRLELDAPVARWIPAFAAGGKQEVTVEQLLTHTSGLPAWLPLYRDYATPEARIAAVFATPAQSPPGTVYLYSDLNMITLGELVELVGGKPLDRYVADAITGPLRMRHTGYNPPAALREQTAATEYQPATGRGLVWGEVHDENAWSLGGVAGHAGVFSTAGDLAILAQTFLNGGRYGRARILRPETVRAMLTNVNTAFPGHEHGLGFELDQHWYMDAMSTPSTAGHTGFTGTMLVLDPVDSSFLILLTNRVHPSRSWGSINPDRRAAARDLARAVPVRPATAPTAWFSGLGDARTATLTLPITLPPGPKHLCFALWYDTEPDYDAAYLELSQDQGTTWTQLPVELRPNPDSPPTTSDGRFTGYAGRRWLSATAPLDACDGPITLRWRYTTDTANNGRGVYVDTLRILTPHGPLFDERHPPDRARLIPNGWTPSHD